jgi:hypothetical protein
MCSGLVWIDGTCSGLVLIDGTISGLVWIDGKCSGLVWSEVAKRGLVGGSMSGTGENSRLSTNEKNFLVKKIKLILYCLKIF